MKRLLFLGGIIFLLLLTACSGENESSKSDSGMAADKASYDNANKVTEEEAAPKEKTSAAVIQTTDRMVIYNAELNLEVEDFKKSQKKIEDLVSKMAGYIVNSQIYDSEVGRMEGALTARIPQKNFQSFLDQAEDLSVKVHSRNVSGQDVTEEYVDLEARLKSKQVVEERLLTFMKEAKETKDLLQISADLAKVQEEIESIKGRMKYLENQTSMSTVTLTLFENKVKIPGLEKEELNTWEKTKKQFMDSLNFLLAAISGIFVFLIGNSPIIILLVIIAMVLWFSRKKYQDKKKSEL